MRLLTRIRLPAASVGGKQLHSRLPFATPSKTREPNKKTLLALGRKNAQRPEVGLEPTPLPRAFFDELRRQE